MQYKNTTAVITGGSKGIGAACARLFFEAGANVAVLDISEDTSDIIDDRWFYISCDVAKSLDVSNAMQAVVKKFGGIDYLVNNAGIQRYGSVTYTSEEEWDLVMNVNLKSLFLCSKYALPFMEENKKGVIINISSVQAFVSQRIVAAYTTAKTAILGLTRSIAVDYAPHIRCIAVCPGTIDTPMLRESFALSPNPDDVLQECIDMHPAGRIGVPDDVGELVLFLCSDKASFITGQAIRVDGGLGITIGGSKRD